MGILDTLFDGPAGRWVQARENMALAEMYFEALIFGGEDNDDNEYPGILPGREAQRMTYDLADWSGISLEFRDYEGDPPSADEREALFALGFTVLRIDYKDRELWTAQHDFHGDWACLKGEVPRAGNPMRFGIDRCPTHFYGNGPDGKPASGQCALLFGHEERHAHGEDAKHGADARL